MRYLLGILFLFGALQGWTQQVKTKDGMEVGERQDFINNCRDGAQKKMDVQGVQMSMEEFCACLCDELIPALNSWELLEATQKNSVESLILEPKNLEIVLACTENKYSIDDDYRFDPAGFDETQWIVANANCVREFMKDPDAQALFTREQAAEYCECALNKFVNKGFTYKELQEIGDEESEAFNEIALPCLLQLMEGGEEAPVSTYAPDDVRGKGKSTRVPLEDQAGQGFKLKVAIGGVARDFVLDTGASDLIIDDELEDELIEAGILAEEDYWGIVNYTLANNEEVPARVYIVSGIAIGDYHVDNVVVASIDGGSLLCGKGLLDKFSHWELRKKEQVLVLFR